MTVMSKHILTVSKSTTEDKEKIVFFILIIVFKVKLEEKWKYHMKR